VLRKCQAVMPRPGQRVEDNAISLARGALDKWLAALRQRANASRVPGQICVTEGGVTVAAQVWDAGAAWEFVSESPWGWGFRRLRN
jgi:hypothetical protein